MLTLQDLIPGKLAVDGSGKLAVIIEHKLNNPKNPIIYTAKPGGTRYKAGPDWFKAIVGEVDLDDFDTAAEETPATRKTTDVDFLVPDSLRGIKIGDDIKIRGRSGIEIVTYQGYNRRRPKYPVSFKRGDSQYKGPLSIVIGKVA